MSKLFSHDLLYNISTITMYSNTSNVELEAVDVLLKSKMWDVVIDVLKEVKSEVFAE